MGFFGSKKEKTNSIVLEKIDQGRQITAQQFDFLFCVGVALYLGYTYAKFNM